MDLESAGKQYHIYITYYPPSSINSGGWMWSVECGYQCFDGSMLYKTASECEKGLKEFLETFPGPTK